MRCLQTLYVDVIIDCHHIHVQHGGLAAHSIDAVYQCTSEQLKNSENSKIARRVQWMGGDAVQMPGTEELGVQ